MNETVKTDLASKGHPAQEVEGVHRVWSNRCSFAWRFGLLRTPIANKLPANGNSFALTLSAIRKGVT